MASDISHIIQSELINTIDSLLSMQSSVDNVSKQTIDNLSDESYIKIDTDLDLNDSKCKLQFYLPTLIATQFEYYILGAMGDVKASIDDETIDACKEIIATVGGGISTTVKAQGFDDLKNFSFSLTETNIIQKADINDKNLYQFDIKFTNDDVNLLMQFDDQTLQYISGISKGEVSEEEEEVNVSTETVNPNLDSLLSLLGENSSENLKLLFDVRLKFSVRLGRKTFLLKDIVNWDVGQIIELEQMVNEPLDILINNNKIGVGEAVIVEGRFGIKVKYIGEDK